MYCQHLLKKKKRLIITSELLKLKIKSDSQELWMNIGELSRAKAIKDSFLSRYLNSVNTRTIKTKKKIITASNSLKNIILA